MTEGLVQGGELGDDDMSPVVEVSINDAYTFRSIIFSMRSMCEQITFLFRKDNFTIQQSGSHNSFFYAVFKEEELPKYCYEAYDDGEDLMKVLPIIVDAEAAYGIFKQIGKNDQINIFLLSGGKSMTIEIIKSKDRSDSDPNLLLIPILNVNQLTIKDEPVYSMTKTMKISAISLAQAFHQAVGCKCKKIVFECFPNSISFKGLVEGGRVGTVNNWGEGSRNSGPKLITVGNTRIRIDEGKSFTFPIDVAKALNKINNFAPNSLVFVRYDVKLASMCITSYVGTYGKFRMYISDGSDKP